MKKMFLSLSLMMGLSSMVAVGGFTDRLQQMSPEKGAVLVVAALAAGYVKHTLWDKKPAASCPWGKKAQGNRKSTTLVALGAAAGVHALRAACNK